MLYADALVREKSAFGLLGTSSDPIAHSERTRLI